MGLREPLFRCQLRQLSRRLEWCTVSEASEAALAAPGTCSMQHPAFELLRIPLPRCEYPGEWPWAASRTGLTLLPRGPQGCLGSDSSAGGLGVALRPPGTGAAS